MVRRFIWGLAALAALYPAPATRADTIAANMDGFGIRTAALYTIGWEFNVVAPSRWPSWVSWTSTATGSTGLMRWPSGPRPEASPL
jgi:hypothetical protein